MIRGIESIAFGAPGDGVAGAVTKTYKDIKVSSMTFSDIKFGTENIPAENKPAYLTVSGEVEPNETAGELYGVPLSELPMLTGGTYDEAKKEYYPPKKGTDIYLTAVITTIATKGKKVQIIYPYAKVTAWREGTLTEKELASLHFNIVANEPVAADGTLGEYTITKEIEA